MNQIADENTWDVFLCHNSQDKPAVEEIGRRLAERGLKAWLDKWDLPPGRPWLPELERIIRQVRAVAVFVGPGGLGPWQQQEQAACLREFVNCGCPVIPVILAGMMWGDFRSVDPDPLERLIWGITGREDELQRLRAEITTGATIAERQLELGTGT